MWYLRGFPGGHLHWAVMDLTHPDVSHPEYQGGGSTEITDQKAGRVGGGTKHLACLLAEQSVYSLLAAVRPSADISGVALQ